MLEALESNNAKLYFILRASLNLYGAYSLEKPQIRHSTNFGGIQQRSAYFNIPHIQFYILHPRDSQSPMRFEKSIIDLDWFLYPEFACHPNSRAIVNAPMVWDPCCTKYPVRFQTCLCAAASSPWFTAWARERWWTCSAMSFPTRRATTLRYGVRNVSRFCFTYNCQCYYYLWKWF